MDPDETRRRIRAAQILGGIESVEDLAQRINVKGLGKDTLYNIRAGDRKVRPHELRLIAEACGLPYEFFTADFNALAPGGGGIDERIRRLEQRLEAVVDEIRDEAIQAAREDLRRAGERAERSAGQRPRKNSSTGRKPA